MNPSRKTGRQNRFAPFCFVFAAIAVAILWAIFGMSRGGLGVDTAGMSEEQILAVNAMRESQRKKSPAYPMFRITFVSKPRIRPGTPNSKNEQFVLIEADEQRPKDLRPWKSKYMVKITESRFARVIDVNELAKQLPKEVFPERP